MTRYPAIILAGGLATRMGGGDKPLHLLDGEQSMLHHIIARLRPQCGAMAINANGDAARFAEFGLPVIADPLPEHPGPLAGILAGMEWAADLNADAILTVAGDTPFFPPDLAERFQQVGSGAYPVLAATRGAGDVLVQHPVCGLWPTGLRGELHGYLLSGGRRVREFARHHKARFASWDGEKVDPFFNVNTPEDLIRARQLIEKVG